MQDPAIDALNKMVAGKFRHLPIIQELVDEDYQLVSNEEPQKGISGAVFGVLDITKCLYDQLERLDKSYSSKTNRSNDNKMGAGERMSSVMDQLLNRIEFPDIASLFAHEPLEAPMVQPETTVLEAVIQMKNTKSTGVLVVSNEPQDASKLLGIFTTKDLVLRVLAAKLSPSETLN